MVSAFIFLFQKSESFPIPENFFPKVPKSFLNSEKFCCYSRSFWFRKIMRLSLGVHYRRCSSSLWVNGISGVNVYRIAPCVFSHKNWHYNFCDGCWVIAIFCVGFGIFLPTNINIGVRMWFQQRCPFWGTLKTIDRAFVQNDIDTVVGFVFS